MASKEIYSVPNEILDKIRSNGSSIFNHVINEAFRTKRGPNDKHGRLWNLIFQGEDWLSAMIEIGLNPVLIGHDLHHLYNTKNFKTNTKSSYLVLVLGRDRSGGKYGKPDVWDKRDLLKDSLKPYTKLSNGELYFPESRLTINIRDAIISDTHYTDISEPRRLVSRKIGGYYSAYLYWNDASFELRTIGPEHILGIERARTEKDVSNIVGLTWEHLPGKKLRQHFFQIPGMVHQTDQISNGKTGDSFMVTGWKWKVGVLNNSN